MFSFSTISQTYHGQSMKQIDNFIVYILFTWHICTDLETNILYSVWQNISQMNCKTLQWKCKRLISLITIGEAGWRVLSGIWVRRMLVMIVIWSSSLPELTIHISNFTCLWHTPTLSVVYGQQSNGLYEGAKPWTHQVLTEKLHLFWQSLVECDIFLFGRHYSR